MMVMFFYSIQAWGNGLAKNNFKAIPKSDTFGCFQECYFKKAFYFYSTFTNYHCYLCGLQAYCQAIWMVHKAK